MSYHLPLKSNNPTLPIDYNKINDEQIKVPTALLTLSLFTTFYQSGYLIICGWVVLGIGNSTIIAQQQHGDRVAFFKF